MIKRSLLMGLVFSFGVNAQDGADLLINQSGVSPTEILVKETQTINLDDSFLVQFYGSFRALNNNQSVITPLMDLVLQKKNIEALKFISNFAGKASPAEASILNSTELYLLYKLGLNHTFFNRWVEVAGNETFLNSQFGVALDQVIGQNTGEWFVKNAIVLSPSQKVVVDSLNNLDSRFNTLVQAYSNLRSGPNSLEAIPKLSAKDPLRLKLADSAVLSFAREGELGKAGSLLKEIYTPALTNNSDVDELSAYHLKLARLLYQAGAYQAASDFYDLIPREAKNYLNAKTENLWISLRSNNHSRIKGDLRTLDLDLFETKFVPEVYLVSAIAHLRLCQFTEVKKSFDAFVRVNGVYANKIEENLTSQTPEVIDEEDFYLGLSRSAIKNLENELTNLKNLEITAPIYSQGLKSSLLMATHKNDQEIKRKWENRKKILEVTIRRMRFVKIEYLSQMRRLSKVMAANSNRDSVKIISSGIQKNRDLEFPHDGIFFGDELFHLNSEVKDLCLRSQK